MDSMLANSIFILVFALLLWEPIPKVVVTLLGACALMLTGVLTQQAAFGFIDWNVIFLLVGMMILVNITRQTGALDWLAYKVAQKTRGSGIKLLVYLGLLTAVCSAFLDNVTTVLFMAAITCTLAQRLKINPMPFLMTEVLASNIGGTATLIGDPPNIMIASAARLGFNDFLIHVAPVILPILAVTLALLTWLYRKDLRFSDDTRQAIAQLETTGLIRDKKLLIQSLSVLILVFLGFIFHHVIHQEVGTIALAGAAVLMVFEDPKDIWNDLEWDTIFFFIGLFMVVGGLEHAGTLTWLAHTLQGLAHGDKTLLTLGTLWLSGLLSAVIDNIPYTATMIPVIQNLGRSMADVQPLWWALSLGACLGGNGTLLGATANVLVADMMARKFNQPIRFASFLAVGGLVTLLSLLVCTLYLWLRYLR